MAVHGFFVFRRGSNLTTPGFPSTCVVPSRQIPNPAFLLRESTTGCFPVLRLPHVRPPLYQLLGSEVWGFAVWFRAQGSGFRV